MNQDEKVEAIMNVMAAAIAQGQGDVGMAGALLCTALCTYLQGTTSMTIEDIGRHIASTPSGMTREDCVHFVNDATHRVLLEALLSISERSQ